MTVRRVLFVAGLELAAMFGMQQAGSTQDQVVGRCVATVPSDWGTFRGAAQGYGLVFEDTAGTLRIVKQIPCGLGGAPNVSVEVRRK